MLIVMVAIGSTDVLFALDSIPAIFGLTKEPYIVFTTNAFALLGLRQLYFLLGGLLRRLVYLSEGLAVILAFIGVKLVLEALHTNEVPFINGGRARVVGTGDPDLAVALRSFLERSPSRPWRALSRPVGPTVRWRSTSRGSARRPPEAAGASAGETRPAYGGGGRRIAGSNSCMSPRARLRWRRWTIDCASGARASTTCATSISTCPATA